MNALCDCPICMDVIDVNKNCITTECGHSFHASCLMTNVSRNGFGCPYCRTAMAQEPEESDSNSDEASEAWSDVSDEEIYNDYALRGLRFMMNNIEGIDHDILDIHDEREDEEQRESEEDENNDIPNSTYITEKLVAQGVTMEQLVKALLINHEEYESDDEIGRVEGDIFGKMRIIISNYSAEDEPAPPVPRPSEPVSTPIPLPCPTVAEPKTPVANANGSRQQSILVSSD
jgi:hypothetical protein